MMNASDSGEMGIIYSIILILMIRCSRGQEMLGNARCNHYPDRGICEDRGFTTKWYYDRYSHRCREFYYGGCEGNENRFDSLEECKQVCSYESPDDPKRRCVLSHDPGVCAGNFERWHFDIRTKQCVCSWWSGCGGNSNLFFSYDHCMSICGIFADNRTSAKRTAARRSINKPGSNEVCDSVSLHIKTKPLTEGRSYRNLFASSSRNGGREVQRSRLQYDGPFPRKRLRLSYERNEQQQQQGTRRYKYLLRYVPSQQLRIPSSRSLQQPGRRAGAYTITRKPARVMETPDDRWMLKGEWERIKAEQMQQQRNHRPSEQSIKQISGYSRPQQMPRLDQTEYQGSKIRLDQASYSHEVAPAHARERLRAQQPTEAYVQQQQAYERARTEALREHERLVQQQHREEYERLVKYQQELQRYQQAVQEAQNRVSKGQVSDTDVRQQKQQKQWALSHTQFQTSSYGQPAISSYEPLPTVDTRTYEEIKRAKLKLLKRQKFEKFKQMERMRRLLKTTPRPITAAPTPPLQSQLRIHQQQRKQLQGWSEKTIREQQSQQQYSWVKQASLSEQPRGDSQRIEPGKERSYLQPHPKQKQQQLQQFQTSSDSHQVINDQVQGQPTTPSTYATQTISTVKPATKITQSEDRRANKLLDIRQSHVNAGSKLDQNAVGQSADSEIWHHRLAQTSAERLPFGMVVAADRVPDRHGVRHAETVSAGPLPTEGIGQGKQIVAVADYEEDEHYEDEDEKWSLSSPLQPVSSTLSSHLPTPLTPIGTMDLATGTQKSEVVTTGIITATTAPVERTTESNEIPVVTAIGSSVKTAKSDKVRDVQDAEDGGEEESGEEEDEYEDSEEIMFWRGQRQRSGRGTEYNYYADNVDTTVEYAFNIT